MKTKRLKYDLFTPKERDYWKNIHINVDSLCDKWEDLYALDLIQLISKLPIELIKQVLIHYDLKKEAAESEIDCLVANKKASIDFLCVLNFCFVNPKSISQLFNIPIPRGKINRVAVVKKVFEYHKKGQLIEIFIAQLQLKRGKGFFQFYFDNAIKSNDFNKYEETVGLLVRTLKKRNKENKAYYYRSSVQTANGWIFLLLKETIDEVYAAIPDNVRVLRGDYLIINIDIKTKKLEINTKSQEEAYRIKDYIMRKTKNSLRYSRETASYNPSDFLSEIKKETDSKKELTLTEIEFRNSKIESSIKIYDEHHKDDIISQLLILKDKDVIRLEDFSEFKNFSFSYKGLSFKITVEETAWGQVKLRFNDKNKPQNEAKAFKSAFSDKFKVPLDIYLTNNDTTVDVRKVARTILNKKTIEADLPKETEDILLDLINLKILHKPSRAVKRRCENNACNKITWIKGDCPSCGNQLYIEGNYIDLKTDLQASSDLIFKMLNKTKLFHINKTKKQIDNSTFQLIDLIDGNGDPLSIFITASNVSDKIIKYYFETGSPLLIILTKFNDALYNDIKKRGFECTDIAEIYSIKDDLIRVEKKFEKYVESQKHLWQQKIIEKGLASYQALTAKKVGYTDQDFERDIFNLFHEIFHIADRLGGKFAGIPAPDGIISLQNYGSPRKRFCLSWDCKYSIASKGYQLNDKADKHRRYINSLRKNGKVILYGDLQTYAIISQNMDMIKYGKFYSRVTQGFRWKGNVIFINEKEILNLYKLYKHNEQVIKNTPKIFFNEVYILFRNIRKKDSTPYKVISKERFIELSEKLEAIFKANRITFTFQRGEFLN